MARVACKECKNEIARSAKVCPHCGALNPAVPAQEPLIAFSGGRWMATFVGWVLIGIGALVLFCGMAGFINPRWMKDPKTGAVPSRMKMLLTTRLGSPVFLGVGAVLVAGESGPEQVAAAPAVASIAPAATPAETSAVAPEALPKEASGVQEKPRIAERNLGVTPEQFRQRFNASIDAIDKDWKLAELDVTSGSVNNVFSRKLGGVSIIGGVSKLLAWFWIWPSPSKAGVRKRGARPSP